MAVYWINIFYFICFVLYIWLSTTIAVYIGPGSGNNSI